MEGIILSASGLRVLIDEKETPSLFFRYAGAFTQLLGPGNYLVATDTRPSRNILLPEVIAGISSQGGEVINLGIAPTPVLLFLVREQKFTGGIVITASHNPIEYNGLKFVGPDGLFLSSTEIEKLRQLAEKNSKPKKRGNPVADYHPKLLDTYIDKILSADLFSGLKFKRFACGVDAVNGATYHIVDKLLERIGCVSMPVFPYSNLVKNFPRDPEPTPKNLYKLRQFVLEKELNLGIAFDPDGDRVSFVSEEGRAWGEELTLPLVLEFFLSRIKSPVVTNLSTSLAVDAVAKKHGCPCYRTKVGERNVIEEMIRREAKVGGEGNGGVIIRDINFTRDGILATLIILAMLSEGKNLSFVAKELPRFAIQKFSFPISQSIREDKLKEGALKILSATTSVKENLLDGFWLGDESSFFHLRYSSTEPIVRIIICSRHRKVFEMLRDFILTEFSSALQGQTPVQKQAKK